MSHIWGSVPDSQALGELDGDPTYNGQLNIFHGENAWEKFWKILHTFDILQPSSRLVPIIFRLFSGVSVNIFHNKASEPFCNKARKVFAE